MMFENRVLRNTFGPTWEEVTRDWRKLHNDELYGLCLQIIITFLKSRRMRWAGHVARMGKKRNVYTFLVGNAKRRRQLGRPRSRCMTALDLKNSGYE
jgi:hypothetical protein